MTGNGKNERQISGRKGGVTGTACMAATVLPTWTSQANLKGRDKLSLFPEGERVSKIPSFTFL